VIEYWKKLSLDIKALLLFLFYLFIVVIRVVVEAGFLASFLGYNVLFHHIFWFSTVLFWFMISFRFIVGMKKEYIAYLSISGLVVFIPIIYAWMASGKARMIYMKSNNISKILEYFGLLMYTHPKNHFLFPELLTLLIGVVAISYFYSKSVKKTVLNIFFGFYASMLLGLHLFGVSPNTKAYIPITTGLKNHILLGLIFHGISFLFFLIIIAPEIKERARQLFFRKKLIYTLPLIPLIWTAAIFFLKYRFRSADYFLLLSPTIIFVSGIYVFKEKLVSPGIRFFIYFYATSGILILLPLHRLFK